MSVASCYVMVVKGIASLPVFAQTFVCPSIIQILALQPMSPLLPPLTRRQKFPCLASTHFRLLTPLLLLLQHIFFLEKTVLEKSYFLEKVLRAKILINEVPSQYSLIFGWKKCAI